MTILGLDPGLARTGFGIIETDNEPQFVQCGLLTSPSTDALADRLNSLGDDLTHLIKKTHPARIAIEEVFFGSNTTTAFLTAQARGVLVYIARHHHVPVSSVTPLQVKMQLTGYGRATKQQVQEMVRRRLNLDTAPQPDDAADALAIALYAADHTPKHQHAIAKKDSKA